MVQMVYSGLDPPGVNYASRDLLLRFSLGSKGNQERLAGATYSDYRGAGDRIEGRRRGLRYPNGREDVMGFGKSNYKGRGRGLLSRGNLRCPYAHALWRGYERLPPPSGGGHEENQRLEPVGLGINHTAPGGAPGGMGQVTQRVFMDRFGEIAAHGDWPV